MKKESTCILLLAFLIMLGQSLTGQTVSYPDSWNQQGFSLQEESASGVTINYSLTDFTMVDINIDGIVSKSIKIPGVFLPNDEGAPDLPGNGRYIAIPQGAEAVLNIIALRKEVIENVEIAPAPNIPIDSDPTPQKYEQDQKKALVREVHHRIKNNLQGVASLLRQHAELNPSVRDQLEAATSQVYTMALVHGIQGKGVHEGMPVSEMLKEVLAIAENITGTNIIYKGDSNYSQYEVNERESVPLALIMNELVTNACKHSQNDSSVNVSVVCNWCLDYSIYIEITNKVDSFPKELSIEEKNGLGTGLKLVVSLLPPEGASLNIREEDGICTTRLVLGKPVIYVRCELNVMEVV